MDAAAIVADRELSRALRSVLVELAEAVTHNA